MFVLYAADATNLDVLEALPVYVPGWVETDEIRAVARFLAVLDPAILYTINSGNLDGSPQPRYNVTTQSSSDEDRGIRGTI